MNNVLTETTYLNFIGGQWHQSASGQTLKTINPSNKETLAEFQRSNAEDVDLAVKAAQEAFDGEWGKTTFTERSKYLFDIQKAIQDNAEQLALVEAMDNGKSINETTAADIPLSADHFEYFGSVARTFQDNHIGLPGADSINISVPLGVVGAIIPWNFPLLMFAWKVAPALAAGNTVVMKVAEQTPLSVLELLKKIQTILPAGVLNVVTGLGEEAGAALASHTGIRKLAFTGSSVVGRMVAIEAAKNGIPCTTELGGKSPVIVLPDADLEKAAQIVVSAATFNQGEVCTCGSRVLVHESIKDELIPLVVKLMNEVKVGDALDTDNTIGAVVSKEQFDKINSYIEYAQNHPDIEVLCGGKADENATGYFIQPTLVLSDNSSKLAQEEIFGPVLTMITYKDEDHALEIANDTSYGLGATIITDSADAIAKFTGRNGIQAGRVWVNTHHLYPAHAPFGGFKDSGIGRETHLSMIAAYTQNKNILIAR